jgi:transmembrane sensor
MKEEQFWILLSKKICGEASPEEIRRLEALLEQHAEWAKAHDTLTELWISKPQPDTKTNQQLEDTYLQHVNRLKANDPDFATPIPLPQALSPRRQKWKIVALMLGGIVILIFGIRLFQSKTDTLATTNTAGNEVKVGFGTKSKIELPDGTQVWINAGSHLSYNNSFKGKTREVTLEGEAYFDVTKDSSRPFIVHTGSIDIRVLGTAFNIKAYTKDPTIEATLVHGSIEVSKSNEPNAPKMMLRPLEKMIFNKTKSTNTRIITDRKTADPQPSQTPSIIITPLVNVQADSTIKEIAWVYNRLVFEEENFADLAVKMERWFDVEIEINNEKLKEMTITGSFQDENLEEALRALQYLVSFKYSIENRKVTINR